MIKFACTYSRLYLQMLSGIYAKMNKATGRVGLEHGKCLLQGPRFWGTFEDSKICSILANSVPGRFWTSPSFMIASHLPFHYFVIHFLLFHLFDTLKILVNSSRKFSRNWDTQNKVIFFLLCKQISLLCHFDKMNLNVQISWPNRS